MAARDILSIEEGRVSIGLESNDSSLDDPLVRYVSAASQWLEHHMRQPVVAYALSAVDPATDVNVLTLTTPKDSSLLLVQEAWENNWAASVGSVISPAATAAGRTITAFDWSGGTVTVDGNPLSPQVGDSLYVGRFATTADVTPTIKMGCDAILAELWRIYRGTTNSGFDDIGAPYVLPNRVMELIPNDYAPGIA